MMRPTCSLLMPLMIVITGMMSTPVGVQVLDGPQFHVEEVADFAVRVGRVADAVELQVGVAQAGFGGLLAEIRSSWRTRCRWWPPARRCSPPRAHSGPRPGSTAKWSVRRRRTARTSGASA